MFISKVKPFTFKALYPKLLFPGKSQIDPLLNAEVDRIVSTMNPFSYFRARAIMKKEDPDVLIVNYWMTLFGPMYAIFSKGFKSSVLKVALIHNINPHEKRFFDTYFNRLFLNRYDAFIVFVIQREDCNFFKIANDIDEEYSILLSKAVKKKLKILCYDCKFSLKGIKLNKKIKFKI